MNLSDAAAWHRPSLRYRFSAAIGTGATWLVLAVLTFAAGIVVPLLPVALPWAVYAPVAAAGLTAVGPVAAASVFVTAGSLRYRLGADAVLHRTGLVSRTSTSLPYEHVQTVTTSNGVIDRMLGLNHVVVQSAADESTITLPGLSESDAESVRSVILERSRLRRSASGSPEH